MLSSRCIRRPPADGEIHGLVRTRIQISPLFAILRHMSGLRKSMHPWFLFLILAVLGSIVAAVYTSSVVLPEGAPEAARESISEAALAAERLPQAVGDALMLSARTAFVDGLHLVIIVSATVTVATFFSGTMEP